MSVPGSSPGGTRWVHRPSQGPVAWGAATLVVPGVPALCVLSLLVLTLVAPGLGSDVRVGLTPLPWLLLGAVLARRSAGRVARGVGIGLLAGAVTAALVAAVAVGAGR